MDIRWADPRPASSYLRVPTRQGQDLPLRLLLSAVGGLSKMLAVPPRRIGEMVNGRYFCTKKPARPTGRPGRRRPGRSAESRPGYEPEDTLVLSEEKFERRLSEETASVNQRISEEANRLDQRITEEASKINQRISEEVNRLEQRISEEANRLDQRITEEIATLRADLRTQIAQTRADLIRWMFVFWVGQLAAILGILFVFFR